MEPVINALIENVLQILVALAVTGIGIAGTWLTAKIGQNTKLKTISAAMDEATRLAQDTVLELQQTVVEDLKAAAADGKLTADEIEALKVSVIDLTKRKMSTAAINLLTAAGVDITALISGVAESTVKALKDGTVLIGEPVETAEGG